MQLSVLDQAICSENHMGDEAVRFAIELGRQAESYGYKRIWLAEHHNTKNYASPSPEMIAAGISQATQTIRVGTGGIMLMHYSPYKIAENMKVLAAMAPGRTDFGAGRAPGGDHDSTYALATAKAPDFSDQYEKLENILKMINEEEAHCSNRRLQDVYTSPDGIQLPEAWLLGSSGNSAQQAGRLGIGYSFAQFFSLNSMKEDIFEAYRQNFQPSAYFDRPRLMVAYLVTVAETEEEAERRALPQDIHLVGQSAGQNIKLPTTERASKMDLTDEVKQIIQANRQRHLVGTAQQVADSLRQEVDRYGIDELMICSNQAEFDYRLDSYRLLAEEMI